MRVLDEALDAPRALPRRQRAAALERAKLEEPPDARGRREHVVVLQAEAQRKHGVGGADARVRPRRQLHEPHRELRVGFTAPNDEAQNKYTH